MFTSKHLHGEHAPKSHKGSAMPKAGLAIAGLLGAGALALLTHKKQSKAPTTPTQTF